MTLADALQITVLIILIGEESHDRDNSKRDFASLTFSGNGKLFPKIADNIIGELFLLKE